MVNRISERHRKELLRFLLLKTAAVRSGVKPAELLRVQHCYRGRNSEGFQFCLYRKDILEILCLDYYELRVDEDSSLILFYHRKKLEEVLKQPVNQRILSGCGYPCGTTVWRMLQFLSERCMQEVVPHEVGIFIGYPAKDVVGFIHKLPRTPVHCGDWAVFGSAGESLRRMALYRKAEKMAESVLDVCEDLQTFFNLISTMNNNRSMTNG